MAATLISLTVLLYIFRDFKKGLVLFGTFFFFLKYFPTGFGRISLSFAACLLLIYTVIIKNPARNNFPLPKPLVLSSLFMISCWLITEFVSGYGNYMGWFNLVFLSFAFPWLMCRCISSKEDITRFLKAFIVAFLIIELYGVFQEITNTNPLFVLINPEVELESGYRFGLVRINSILVFSSTLGTFSMFAFYLFSRLKRRSNFFNSNITLFKLPLGNYHFLMFLAIFGIACSATRSCYLMFAVVLTFIFLDNIDTSPFNRILIFLIIGVSLVLIYVMGFSDLLSGLVTRIDQSAEGSSSEMRENQLEICLYWMRDSPIWGNGRNYIFKEVALWDEDIYGAESLWFRLLVDYGIMGCISYIMWIVSIIVVLWKYNRYYIVIPLTLLFGKTTSILMDVDFEYFLWLSIVIIKCHQFIFTNNIPYHTNKENYLFLR